jgi:hypothetical protein
LSLKAHLACALTSRFLCLECAKSELCLLQSRCTIGLKGFTSLLECGLSTTGLDIA